MNKYILLRKTSKYISIQSYLVGRLNIIDPEQEIIYLNLDVDYNYLGREIRKKLNECKKLSEHTLTYYLSNDEDLDNFLNSEEKNNLFLWI